MNISDATIDQVIGVERAESQRLDKTYRGASHLDLARKVAILVEDGTTTASAMRTAVSILRLRRPAPIVVAVPVASPASVLELGDQVDEIVTCSVPTGFQTVGQWYEDFVEISEESVRDLYQPERHIKDAGIEDNTIVIFASDNGPEGSDPWEGDSGPWRGTYLTAMEASLRAPFIIRWPGRVPAGRVTNEIVHIVDMYPTLARVAGAEVPKDRVIDGIDQLDFFLGKQENSNREGFPAFVTNKLYAVKWRNWKMHLIWQVGMYDPPQTLEEPRIINLLTDLKEERDVGAKVSWVAVPRAAFITGQQPIRTGLTKVGMPGADVGLRAEDPTIAEFLKPLGYATGQFGKNHLGDKDEFLPTNHGFDEFFGNLYHLNAEEEPEDPDYPKDPQFKKQFGPRGVIHSYADGRIEDTGPLTKKRMETVDEEFLAAALDFIDRQHKAGKPFFLWFNSTRMHIWTHLKPESEGKTGLGLEADGMVEHDGMVGQLLKKLDDLGIADNTIVVYTTDNGAEVMTWPDGGTTPFRGEKATNWEGGFRVPTAIRWPGVIKPGTIYNDMFAHMDFLPTFCAAAGDPDVVAKCLKGDQVGNKTFKVHLDGYNLIPFFKGEVKASPRRGFIYWSDDGDVFGIRVGRWKVVFLEQLHEGIDVWRLGFEKLRAPKIFDMLADPFERGDSSMLYDLWFVHHVYLQYGANAIVGEWLQSFKEFPPRQKPASFNLDEVMRKLSRPNPGHD